MRLTSIMLGAAVLLGPQLARATTIFDSVNVGSPNSGNETVNGSWDWIDPTAQGPNASQFSLAYVQTISSVSLVLSADNPSDGGSVVVVLLPDNNGAPPYSTIPGSTSSGGNVIASFTDATVLGTISDSSLSQNSGLYTINTGVTLAAGKYWIGTETSLLPGQTDPVNGSYGSGQWWWENSDAADPSTLNFNNNQAVGPFAVGGSVNPGGYQLIIDAPEPAALGILGAGLVGLGFVRRRRSVKV